MVTGLRFKVSAEELERHFKERAAHYKKLVSKKTAAVAKKKPLTDWEDRDFEFDELQSKASAFSFYADHLFDEHYDLGSYELKEIELVRERETGEF